MRAAMANGGGDTNGEAVEADAPLFVYLSSSTTSAGNSAAGVLGCGVLGAASASDTAGVGASGDAVTTAGAAASSADGTTGAGAGGGVGCGTANSSFSDLPDDSVRGTSALVAAAVLRPAAA